MEENNIKVTLDLSRLAKEVGNRLVQMVVNALRMGDSYKSPVFDVSLLVKDAFAAVDMYKVKEQVTAMLQEEIAKRIVNNMLTEMGHDIKSIMSNERIREDFKYELRKGVETILAKIREDDNK